MSAVSIAAIDLLISRQNHDRTRGSLKLSISVSLKLGSDVPVLFFCASSLRLHSSEAAVSMTVMNSFFPDLCVLLYTDTSSSWLQPFLSLLSFVRLVMVRCSWRQASFCLCYTSMEDTPLFYVML